MRIEKRKPGEERVDAFVVPFFEDVITDEARKIIGEGLSFIRSQGFSGKKGETIDFLDGRGKYRIIVLGLGNKKDLTPETLRRSYSKSFSIFKRIERGTVEILLPNLDPKVEAKEVTFSIILASYDFDMFKQEKNEVKVERILINTEADESVIKEAITLANAVNYTRDIANLPPSLGT
ncbi:MAG: M17 family peptidase N-terminal domain-containing protein, partial [Thermoplasmatales archaeon]